MVISSYSSLEPLALANWTQALERSSIQRLLELTTHPDIISFALGLPAPELFPAAAIAQVSTEVLAHDHNALQYQPALRSLKTEIVGLMHQRGVQCSEEQVFLTTGAQQAMSLLTRLLVNPHDQVLVEETIYSGFLQAIAPLQPQILTVGTDSATGMDVDALEALLQRGVRPALIYAIADGHNPLATGLSMEKRVRLIELACRFGVPILEDDAYGLLTYTSHPSQALRALDPEWVFYMGSFSKILAPALRVGWIIAPEVLMPKLAVIKEATDINTATFSQRLIAAYFASGAFPAHLATLRQEYRRRRDAMDAALRAHLSPTLHWRLPNSGLFIWAELPVGWDSSHLLEQALSSAKVAFVPGHAFSVGGHTRAAHGIRLNFSNCPPARIAEGVARLGQVIDAVGRTVL